MLWWKTPVGVISHHTDLSSAPVERRDRAEGKRCQTDGGSVDTGGGLTPKQT